MIPGSAPLPHAVILRGSTCLRAVGTPLALFAGLGLGYARAQQAVPPLAAMPLPIATAAVGQVEDVVVTARHRSEKLQKVPIAISVVSAAKLDATGTNSLNQLAALVPSLQITQFNPRNTSFNIRGVGNNVVIANDG